MRRFGVAEPVAVQVINCTVAMDRADLFALFIYAPRAVDIAGEVPRKAHDMAVRRHFSQMLPAHAENIAVLLDVSHFLRAQAIDEAHIILVNILCFNLMADTAPCKGE